MRHTASSHRMVKGFEGFNCMVYPAALADCAKTCLWQIKDGNYKNSLAVARMLPQKMEDGEEHCLGIQLCFSLAVTPKFLNIK